MPFLKLYKYINVHTKLFCKLLLAILRPAHCDQKMAKHLLVLVCY